MIKRGMFVFVFLILLIDLSSANFVCGEIKNAPEVTSSWFNVMSYYPENPLEFTKCKVSPENNRFCCDPYDIKEINWGIGKIINVKLNEKGYLAGPVSLTISGEGFDVFPEMQLKKVIKINKPDSGIYLGDSVFVNFSTIEEFNKLRYRLSYNGSVENVEICEGCNSAEFYLENLDRGEYELEIIASNVNGEEITEKKVFSLIDYINIEREIECNGCKNNNVPVGQIVNVSILIKTSHNVSGVLRDYFPGDWAYLEGGDFDEFSESHNKVSWKIEGESEIKERYMVKSPDNLLTRRYIFQSGFEDYEDYEDRVTLFKWYKFFPINEELTTNKGENLFDINYLRVSPSNPLVMILNEKELLEVAIFPKLEEENVNGYVHENSPVRMKKAGIPFVVGTDMGDLDIEKILIRFKVRNTGDKISYLDRADLYWYSMVDDEWILTNTSESQRDEDYVHYEAWSKKKGVFAIKKEYERT